jgi:hypothetical protein
MQEGRVLLSPCKHTSSNLATPIAIHKVTVPYPLSASLTLVEEVVGGRTQGAPFSLSLPRCYLR